MRKEAYWMVRQQGAGMVEVLVAVLVLAIGVLGYAGLQTRAMQSTGDAYVRAQAMAIAQDLAERVRMNRDVIATYRTPSNWTASAIPTTAPTSCQTANCNAATMATYDIDDIRYNAAALLPSGLVSMEVCQASSMTCIYVAWNGISPTAGTTGRCVNDTGKLVSNPDCIMLEML